MRAHRARGVVRGGVVVLRGARRSPCVYFTGLVCRRNATSRPFVWQEKDRAHHHHKLRDDVTKQTRTTTSTRGRRPEEKKTPRIATWRVARRVARVALELGAIQLRKWRNVNVEIRARKMREAFVRLGPAFVKIGQALSTRRDALPSELCDELGRLQDEMPPTLSGARAMRVIEEELGAPITELFHGLSETSVPIAAASLGQVYKATDAKTGISVAVKVRRDDVAEAVALDAVALRLVAKVVGRIAFLESGDYFADVVDEVVGKIREETDYRREARSAAKFAALYLYDDDDDRARRGVGFSGGQVESSSSSEPTTSVVAPRVVERLCGDRVLTLVWVEGAKLDKWGATATKAQRSKLVEIGVRCTVAQFFERGFYHGDPHPGNLLVTPDEKLAYLDFGKMGVLEPSDRLALMTVLVHYVNRDARGLARDFVDLGCVVVDGRALKPRSRPPEKLVDALEKTFAEKKTKEAHAASSSSSSSSSSSTSTTTTTTTTGFSVRRLSFRGVLTEVRDALPDTGKRDRKLAFRLPARFATIVRALGALEGAVLAVDPTFQVVAAAYPHVARALLADAGPAGRQALSQLLVDDASGRVRWRRLRALFAGDEHQSGRQRRDDKTARHRPTLLTDLAAEIGADTLAALAHDVLDYLASPEGFKTRNALTLDLEDLLFRRQGWTQQQQQQQHPWWGSSRGTKPEDDDDDDHTGQGSSFAAESPLCLLQRPLEDLARLVLDAPHLWLPVVAKFAALPETHRAALLLLDRGLRRDHWRAPALALRLFAVHVLKPFSS